MEHLLQVQDLKKHFVLRKHFFSAGGTELLRAVDGVSLHVSRGETLALVGESGCGKSTLARLVLRLMDSTGGRILFDGDDITNATGPRLRDFRRRMQIVFQDPFSSLSPRLSVRQIIEEPMLVHGIGDRRKRLDRVAELLGFVGLDLSYAERRPHQFSGGQRQRIGIARALALQPELVVCDEPVSALDVSIQAQIINLLKDLQAQFGLAYLFIAHDLAIVKHMADRVAVMYMGNIVETGSRNDLFRRSRHPYTRSLLASIPGERSGGEEARAAAKGEQPSPLALPPGCRFYSRCPFRMDACQERLPSLKEVAPGHLSACLRWRDLPAPDVPTDSQVATPVTTRLALYEARRGERNMNADPPQEAGNDGNVVLQEE